MLPERRRLLAAGIPGARYVSLPSANHLMLEEEPAWSLFLEELGMFLNLVVRSATWPLLESVAQVCNRTP